MIAIVDLILVEVGQGFRQEKQVATARQQGRWLGARLQPTALLRQRDGLDYLATGRETPAQPCS